MKIEDRIKNMILSKYGSIKSFSEKIGIPYTTVDSIFKRGFNNANISNMLPISNELDLDLESLADGKLASKNKALVNNNNGKTKQIPILSQISAGSPIPYTENDTIEYLEVPLDSKIDFGFIVKGDSMIGDCILNGDYAFIRKQPMVEHQEICAVRVGDEITLKRVTLLEDKIILLSSNKEYLPIIYDRDVVDGNIEIIGKYIKLERFIR